MSDVNTKLTALADEVRDLSGTTAPKSIDAMISDIAMANAEVVTQADLISDQDAKLAELAEILSNKASVSPVLQSKTITPTASEQTVTADSGYDGLRAVTVNGDANLVAENIVSGVSIFGIEGSAETSGGGTLYRITIDAQNASDPIVAYGVDSNGEQYTTQIPAGNTATVYSSGYLMLSGGNMYFPDADGWLTIGTLYDARIYWVSTNSSIMIM